MTNLPVQDLDKEKKLDLVECGHCEKMITYDQIGSFGADHHDPDELMCWDCFGDAIDSAQARMETI